MDQFRLREIARLAKFSQLLDCSGSDSDTDQLCQLHCSLWDTTAHTSKVKFLCTVEKNKTKLRMEF